MYPRAMKVITHLQKSKFKLAYDYFLNIFYTSISNLSNSDKKDDWPKLIKRINSTRRIYKNEAEINALTSVDGDQVIKFYYLRKVLRKSF